MSLNLDEDAQKKQLLYRDARINKQYDGIWQNVGKCAFCDLKDKYILHEENGMVLTITLYAYIDGHLMIIPRRHVRSVKELTGAEWEAVRKLMYLAKKIIKDAHGIKGMQFIQKDGSEAQSTVEHIHFHCIPFDDPGLSTWHYRKLHNTPLQNVALYKQKANRLQKLAKRFDEKYGDKA
jgi:histidine triad (HIT) family protein